MGRFTMRRSNRMVHWCDWRKPCEICDESMRTMILRFWCRLVGHTWVMQGRPILHAEGTLVETDYDCQRCGLKVTNVE